VVGLTAATSLVSAAPVIENFKLQTPPQAQAPSLKRPASEEKVGKGPTKKRKVSETKSSAPPTPDRALPPATPAVSTSTPISVPVTLPRPSPSAVEAPRFVLSQDLVEFSKFGNIYYATNLVLLSIL
jgi:hypothetical protein